MIYSSNVGDYKFPGGCVDEGESHAQALRREVSEECGAELTHIGEEIGAVIEYNFADEAEFDTFKMTSHYYRCEVTDGFGAQKLDGYERDLGFMPVWISIEDALQHNKTLLTLPQRVRMAEAGNFRSRISSKYCLIFPSPFFPSTSLRTGFPLSSIRDQRHRHPLAALVGRALLERFHIRMPA